jgi:hypothetical protein
VQKKRRDLEVEAAGGQPSRSYAYRVLLDRDDYAFEATVQNLESDDHESHAETASDPLDSVASEGGCQPVGTGVPTPGDGTPANPYDGTSNVPFEATPSERERDARARDRKARFLVDFEKRWPSAASDNRQRTAYAADALSEAEEEGALAGIAPFLENQKRLHRKNVPAGWRYLEEKRWTLLDAAKEAGMARHANYAADSVEAEAITVLYQIAHATSHLRKIWTRPDGSIDCRTSMTPQLLAFAKAPQTGDWVTLDRQQAAALEHLLGTIFQEGMVRHHVREGSRAPWLWPPSVEGKIYTTGPPQAELTEQDMADFK